MRYALLIYGNIDALGEASPEELRRFTAGVGAVCARPEVSGHLRLHGPGSATTVGDGTGGALVTDGPFVDSKDFLGGFIVVEAEDLDGAIAVADELHRIGATAAIEVRPVNEDPLPGA